MQSANVEVVQAMYDGFAEGNVDAVLALMSENITWNEAENFIYADKNPYIGPQGVAEGVFARIGGEWEFWNLEDMTVQGAGNANVVAQGRYKAKNKATGKELNAQFVHYWTIEDGKATKFQQYTDTKQAAEVVIAD
jgi:ketosteroid isomerase-like protein